MRKNDILMFYSGAAVRNGLAGLMIDDVMVVPARVLVIVWPYAVSRGSSRSPDSREDKTRLARPINPETKAFLSLETLRGYEIDGSFVNAMNEADDRTRELISHYRDSHKAEEDMIYAI